MSLLGVSTKALARTKAVAQTVVVRRGKKIELTASNCDLSSVKIGPAATAAAFV
jgi:hypothetical protein